MNIALIILVVSLSIALFVIYNLNSKVEHQELLLASREEYLSSLHIQLIHAADRIVELDTKGVFRSEDEVGTFFDELVLIAKDIEEVIGRLVE